MEGSELFGFVNAYRKFHLRCSNLPPDPMDFTCWMPDARARVQGRALHFDYIWGRSSKNGTLLPQSCEIGGYSGSDHQPVIAEFRYLRKVPLTTRKTDMLRLCGTAIKKSRYNLIWSDEMEKLREEIRLRATVEDLMTDSNTPGVHEADFAGISLECVSARGIKPTLTFEATTAKGRKFQLGELPEVKDNLDGILALLDAHNDEFVNTSAIPRTISHVTEMTPEIDESKGSFPPLKYKGMSPSELLDAKEYVQNMVRAGKMEPAVPPVRNAGYPVMAYRNCKGRLCWNYLIKEHIKPTYWALKLMDEVLFTLAKGVYRSVVDLAKGYNQSPIAEKSRWMTNVAVGDKIYRSETGPLVFQTRGSGSAVNYRKS